MYEEINSVHGYVIIIEYAFCLLYCYFVWCCSYFRSLNKYIAYACISIIMITWVHVNFKMYWYKLDYQKEVSMLLKKVEWMKSLLRCVKWSRTTLHIKYLYHIRDITFNQSILWFSLCLYIYIYNIYLSLVPLYESWDLWDGSIVDQRWVIFILTMTMYYQEMNLLDLKIRAVRRK